MQSARETIAAILSKTLRVKLSTTKPRKFQLRFQTYDKNVLERWPHELERCFRGARWQKVSAVNSLTIEKRSCKGACSTRLFAPHACTQTQRMGRETLCAARAEASAETFCSPHFIEITHRPWIYESGQIVTGS